MPGYVLKRGSITWPSINTFGRDQAYPISTNEPYTTSFSSIYDHVLIVCPKCIKTVISQFALPQKRTSNFSYNSAQATINIFSKSFLQVFLRPIMQYADTSFLEA